MKKIFALVLVSAGVLFLSGCGNGNNTSNVSNNNQGVTSQNQNQGTENNQINIQNFVFNPSTLTVNKGTTVTWTNNDSAQHQIKSDTFNSNPLSKGQTYSFTFNETGTYDYSCAIHPSMRAKIVVQ